MPKIYDLTMCVISAKYLEQYKLDILFSNKKSRSVDFSNFIVNNPNPLINKFKDLRRFRHFKIENGNLVWGKDRDLIFPVSDLYKGKI